MTEPVGFGEVRTALGTWFVARTEHGLCLLTLDAERGPGELARWIARHAPGATPVEDHAGLAPAADELCAYARGERRDFELALDLRGSEFQRRVWDALRRIPYGRTRTYGELASELGQSGASRAVGAANGQNPVPVVVPCHRVVARDGLGGFTGGLDHKRRLLAHEGALLFS